MVLGCCNIAGHSRQRCICKAVDCQLAFQAGIRLGCTIRRHACHHTYILFAPAAVQQKQQQRSCWSARQGVGVAVLAGFSGPQCFGCAVSLPLPVATTSRGACVLVVCAVGVLQEAAVVAGMCLWLMQ
jgi:hypothetical protein